MKTKTLRIAIVLLGVGFFLADNTVLAQSKVQAGPFWGQGVRMITGNEEFDIGPGYHGGIIVQVPLTEQLALNPSVSIARKGFYLWEFGFWDDDNIISFNQKLTYLDFYIPVKFKVAGIFNLQTGFQLGVLLDADLVIDSYNSPEKFKTDIKDDLSPIDMGFIIGAGVQFKNGIGLDLIINQGLVNNYEETPPNYVDHYNNGYAVAASDGKNLGVTINVSYLFGYAPAVTK